MTAHRPEDLDLESLAAALPIPPGDVADVIERSRQRSRRTTAATALVAAVALVATAAGITRYADGNDTTPLAAGGAAVVSGDVPMRWERVDPTTALGMSRGATDADQGASPRPVYALSTAPGDTDLSKPLSRVIWRSDDGIEWSAASTLTNDFYLSDLAATDGRIYAVGTSAAQGATKTPAVLVGWSDDQAKSWKRANLDIDLAAIAAKSTHVAVITSDIATGKHGTVALVVVAAQLDVRTVLPAGVTAPNGWAITPTGVDLLAGRQPAPDTCPSGTTIDREEPQNDSPRGILGVSCVDADRNFARTVRAQDAYGVASSFTWQQLNVTGNFLRAVRQQPIAFYAPPGSTDFKRVEMPATDSSYGFLLQATNDGFDLAISRATDALTGAGEARFLQSADGQSWTTEPQPIGNGLSWVTAMGRIDGQVAIIGGSDNGAVLLRRTGTTAGAWTSTSLARAVDPSLTKDATAYVTMAAIGPLGAVAVLGVVGNDGKDRGDTPPYRVVVTRDGTTWSDSSLDELAGAKTRGVARVAIVGDKALVATSVANPAKADKFEQVVLVGTPL
jgi:hypothetical protein